MAKVTQAHIDARTNDILGAAMRSFARRGVENTTMQEIAAEADLSAGAIYRYFPSKEHLLRGVFANCTEENRAVFAQAAASTTSPLEAIQEIGRSAWDELKSEGFKDGIMLTLETTLAAARQPDELGKPRRDMLRELIDMLAGLIGEAQSAGEIDSGVDARALATTMLACHLGSGLLALQLEDGVDPDSVFDVVMEMLRKLAPRAMEPAVIEKS